MGFVVVLLACEALSITRLLTKPSEAGFLVKFLGWRFRFLGFWEVLGAACVLVASESC